jgi:hypothetical protein
MLKCTSAAPNLGFFILMVKLYMSKHNDIKTLNSQESTERQDKLPIGIPNTAGVFNHRSSESTHSSQFQECGLIENNNFCNIHLIKF